MPIFFVEDEVVGKQPLARLFAKAINCMNPQEDGEPCNECHSCREITSGQSLDVIEIDGASNRGIEDIRQINDTIGYAASNGKDKIYIIDEVHMLTKEAFNALLKTLEEPPAHVRFFFATTEPHRIPLTILSRCQRFDLAHIDMESILEKLKSICSSLAIDVEEQALAMIARRAEGSMRDAESYLDQLLCYHQPPISYQDAVESLGLIDQEHFFELDRCYESENLSGVLKISSALFSTTAQHHFILETLLQHYRNLMQLQLNYPHSILPHHLDNYKEHAQIYTLQQLMHIANLITKEMEFAYKTPYKSFHLELLFLQIVESKKTIDYSSLLQRLEELEQRLSSGSNPEERSLASSPSPRREDSLPSLENSQDFPKPEINGMNVAKNENSPSVVNSSEAPSSIATHPLILEKPQDFSKTEASNGGISNNAVQTPVTSPADTPSSEAVESIVSSDLTNTPDEKNKAKSSDPSNLSDEKKTTDSLALSQSLEQRQKHERLLRFAAVELNGTVKK